MKILIAVDGSNYTKKMLAYLGTHPTLLDPSHHYTLINAQASLPPRARTALGREVVAQYYREEAEKTLAPVGKFLLRHGINAKSAWKTGQAGEVIAKFASAGSFDLIVMGSHGHGGLVNLVMGSVATTVLAECEVPVLLVR